MAGKKKNKTPNKPTDRGSEDSNFRRPPKSKPKGSVAPAMKYSLANITNGEASSAAESSTTSRPQSLSQPHNIINNEDSNYSRPPKSKPNGSVAPTMKYSSANITNGEASSAAESSTASRPQSLSQPTINDPIQESRSEIADIERASGSIGYELYDFARNSRFRGQNIRIYGPSELFTPMSDELSIDLAMSADQVVYERNFVGYQSIYDRYIATPSQKPPDPAQDKS